MRYFNFYTYQKMTSCWKRRGPQVCDTYFSGLVSLYFNSDHDRRKEYYWVMIDATNIFRKANICTTQIKRCLNSKARPDMTCKRGSHPYFDHIFTNQHFLSHKIGDLQNIVVLVIQSLLVKRFISFKKVRFLVLNEI